MEVTVKILAIIVCFAVVGGKHIPSFAGPYRIIPRSIVPPPANSYGFKNLLVTRVFATHPPNVRALQYSWGYSQNEIPIDDTLNAEVRISSWSNNEWKPNAFVLKFPNACSFGMRYSKSLMGCIFGEDAQQCPIPKGRHEVKNHTIDPLFPSVPVFPYGKYLFNVTVYKQNALVMFVGVDGECVPRL